MGPWDGMVHRAQGHQPTDPTFGDPGVGGGGHAICLGNSEASPSQWHRLSPDVQPFYEEDEIPLLLNDVFYQNLAAIVQETSGRLDYGRLNIPFPSAGPKETPGGAQTIPALTP